MNKKNIKTFLIIQITLCFLLLKNVFANAELNARPWSPPDYKKQFVAIGYDKETFAVPKELADQVHFWEQIYADYDEHQGLIHDNLDLSIVYEIIDLSAIQKSSEMSERKKIKTQENLVNTVKKSIRNVLLKFADDPNTKNLNAFEEKILKIVGKGKSSEYYKSLAQLERMRLQTGLKSRTKKAIQISGKYLPEMEDIFKGYGLPIELTRLVFVESSFNVFARSKVGASGLWQIMKSAARGQLRVNQVVDLRNDPFEATKMAAKILKQNYAMLESWPLAITGYNHGPHGVKRLLAKNKANNLVDLINGDKHTVTFGFASRNFYACFLAALKVEGNANDYFKDLQIAAPLNYKKIILNKDTRYSEIKNIFLDDLETQTFNPHIQLIVRKGRQSLSRGSHIYVPVSKVEVAENLNKNIQMEMRSIAQQQKNNEFNSSKDEKQKTYIVARGDTLEKISNQFGISIKKLVAVNEIKRARIIFAGQKLVIP